MTQRPARSPLAVHWRLEPGAVFLNHGSFGACPRQVLDHQTELRARLESQPVTFLVRELEERLDVARLRLSAFLGANPDGLAFVPNATAGVNTVLQALELRAGDEILVTDHGYRACRNAVDRLAARTGAVVVVAELPFPLSGPDDVIAALEAVVTPRTRFCLIDHVTSPTAVILPVERIVPWLQGLGVDVLVDGAHAPGMVPLDLESLGAAFYTGNCHKWLCAPKGAAFLHIREDWVDRVTPLATSHGATLERTDRSRFRLEHDWTGTADPTPFLTIPAALDTIAGFHPQGWTGVMAHNHALAAEAQGILCEALGTPLPVPPEMLGSLASVILPPLRVPAVGPGPFEPLQEWLWQAHRVEVPVIPWPSPRVELLRVSGQLYNTTSEYRFLADLLRSVA